MKYYIHIVVSELFYVSLVLYLVLLVIDTLQTGFVSPRFLMDVNLGVVVMSGLITALTKRTVILPDYLRTLHMTERDMYTICIVSISAGVIVYIKTYGVSEFALFMSVLSVILTGIFSYFLHKETS